MLYRSTTSLQFCQTVPKNLLSLTAAQPRCRNCHVLTPRCVRSQPAHMQHHKKHVNVSVTKRKVNNGTLQCDSITSKDLICSAFYSAQKQAALITVKNYLHKMNGTHKSKGSHSLKM